MSESTEMKERQRAIWAAGDFAQVASRIEGASEAMVAEFGLERGQDLLDVACGTGNASIPAARLGARVTGLDLTPKLLVVARERARDEGLKIEFVEGDAEALPYADGTFDRVISVFGAMFAPDHARAMGELVRVARPGGRLGFCAWTPTGLIGKMFMTVAGHMPPPPPGFLPPVLWGYEDHVRTLLAEHGLEPSSERRTVTFEAESVEEFVAFDERTLGPIVMAKAALEPQGGWGALRNDLGSMYAEANQASDGTLRVEAEYMLTTVDLPG